MLGPADAQARSAKPEQFVDLSFLNEVEKEDLSPRWRTGIRRNNGRTNRFPRINIP